MTHPAAILALICALLAPGAAAADSPGHGLMWRKSALPAVFPLQVKSAPGADYYLTLTRDGAAAPMLAAYIEGGQFFRVLVPPGSFDVVIHRGWDWQGETALFGARTTEILRQGPLVFRTKGLRVKAGHLLDLTQLDRAVQAAPLRFCQARTFLPQPVSERQHKKAETQARPRYRRRERLC